MLGAFRNEILSPTEACWLSLQAATSKRGLSLQQIAGSLVFYSEVYPFYPFEKFKLTHRRRHGHFRKLPVKVNVYYVA